MYFGISSIEPALSCMLEYSYNPQERYNEARRRSPLPEIYLIRIKVKDVDIEPRFLPFVPDRF